MISDFISGARFFLRGLALIFTPGVRRYVMLPTLINLVLFSILIYFGISWFDVLINKLVPSGDSWWTGLAQIILFMLFGSAILMAMFFSFTLITNLVGAPFNGLLAQRIEEKLTGQVLANPSSLLQVVKDFGPAVLGELQKYVYFLFIAFLLMIVFFIPGPNLILGPLGWIIFGSWMLTLEYVAYPMGNHNKAFKEVRGALRSYRMMGLGFGLATMAATMVPIVNFIVMPAAVAGATAMWVEHWRVKHSS